MVSATSTATSTFGLAPSREPGPGLPKSFFFVTFVSRKKCPRAPHSILLMKPFFEKPVNGYVAISAGFEMPVAHRGSGSWNNTDISLSQSLFAIMKRTSSDDGGIIAPRNLAHVDPVGFAATLNGKTHQRDNPFRCPSSKQFL